MSTDALVKSARDTYRHAANYQATVKDKHRLFMEQDQGISRAILDYRELPSLADLHAQAKVALDIVSAAQQYHRDLLKLLALAGGYDKEEA